MGHRTLKKWERRSAGAAVAGVILMLSGLAPQASQAASKDQCSLPSGDLQISDLPAGSSVIDCDAVGRTVVHDDLSLTVPDVGDGIGASVVSPEDAQGDGSEFYIFVDSSGLISYWTSEDDAGGTNAPPIGACNDSNYTNTDFELYDNEWDWKINHDNSIAGSTTYTNSQLDGWMQQDANRIDASFNNCRLDDEVSAINNYLGTTSESTHMHLDSDGYLTCDSYGGAGSTGVVGYGAIPERKGPELGLTCTYFAADRHLITRNNVRINSSDFGWTNDPTDPSCGEFEYYDFQSVVTHEFGHTIGLLDIKGDENQYETMHSGVDWCSLRHRSLAWGDVLAERLNY